MTLYTLSPVLVIAVILLNAGCLMRLAEVGVFNFKPRHVLYCFVCSLLGVTLFDFVLGLRFPNGWYLPDGSVLWSTLSGFSLSLAVSGFWYFLFVRGEINPVFSVPVFGVLVSAGATVIIQGLFGGTVVSWSVDGPLFFIGFVGLPLLSVLLFHRKRPMLCTS